MLSKTALFLSIVLVVGWSAALQGAFTWDLQTVEAVPSKVIGSHNAIAVSPLDGEFHVVYGSASLARLSEGRGTSEPYTVTNGIAPAGLHRWVDVAVAGDNTVWATSCNTWSGGAVNATYSTGAGFTNEIVTTGSNAGSSIAVRHADNQPVVVYGTGANLMYAQRTSPGAWTTPQVIDTGKRFEDAQMLLTGSDIPMIAYRNDWAYDLKFATFNPTTGSWENEIMASNIMNSNNDGSSGYDDDQFSKVLDLALDSTEAAVVAYTDTSGHVNLLRRAAAGSYNTVTLTSSGIARSVAVAIDDQDVAYVAFNDVTKGDLLLATYDLGTDSLDIQTVIDNSAIGKNVQRFLDIALQTNGLPVISFFDMNSISSQVAVAVPEPATVGLLLLGGFLWRTRKP